MDAPADPARRRRVLFTLVGITVAAAAWRLASLDLESLWYDEAISLDLARRPFAEILENRALDGHPPAYFFLLRAWTLLFGDSPTALRALSVIPGTLVVPLLYLVAARWRGAAAGLVVAALAAGSRFLAHYSQEARDYAFLFLFATAAFLALDRARERPTGGRLAAWSALLAATLWSSVYGLAVLGTQALWLAGVGLAARARRGADRPPWRAALPWLAALLAAVALFSPWLLVLARRAETAAHDLWVPLPTPAALGGAFVAFAGSRRGLALFAPAVLLGLWRELAAPGADRRRGWLLVAWLVGPVLLPWLASYVALPVFVQRGTIVGVGAFLLLAALGLDALRPRRALCAVAAGLVVYALAFGAVRQVDRRDKEDWRGLAALVAERAEPKDVLLLWNRYEMVAYRAYAARDDLVLATHADAAEGRAPWGEHRVVFVVESPHQRRGDEARAALAAAGFALVRTE
ncbi:MAG TPA: glycosyltransferase family 39 protein, partial [Anaeromyxobacter sp.]